MDVASTLESYTIEDIYALPEGERAELIDGKIYYMAPPSTRHQRIISDIHYRIKDYIIKNNGECEVLPAPFAVFLNKDNKNYVEPDISIICDKDKITDKGCHGAPDWVIEIISPGNKEMDYFKKLFKYQAAGVREYWIVDPIKEMVMVYRFEKETMEEYSFGEDIPVGIYEGFSIKVQ
jgi:Uma2 family endonuclease